MGRLTDPASKEPTDAVPETAAWDPPARKAANTSVVPYLSVQWKETKQSACGRSAIICISQPRRPKDSQSQLPYLSFVPIAPCETSRMQSKINTVSSL